MKTNSEKYLDGFVKPIKKKDLAAYKKMAQWRASMWKKNGALEYFECVGDDLKIKKGADIIIKDIQELPEKII